MDNPIKKAFKLRVYFAFDRYICQIKSEKLSLNKAKFKQEEFLEAECVFGG